MRLTSEKKWPREYYTSYSDPLITNRDIERIAALIEERKDEYSISIEINQPSKSCGVAKCLHYYKKMQ